RVAESHTGNDVTLEVRQPHFRVDWGIHINRSIVIDVWVPRGVDLDVNTGDGDVLIEDAKGDLRLKTGDGRITGERLEGTLNAHTGDGTMRVEGKFQDLDLNTGDGGITAEVLSGSVVRDACAVTAGDGHLTLVIPPDRRADLSAHTGDGNITVDLPLTLQGRVSHHDVRGSLNGGGPLLTLRTGDGSIQLSSR